MPLLIPLMSLLKWLLLYFIEGFQQIFQFILLKFCLMLHIIHTSYVHGTHIDVCWSNNPNKSQFLVL